MAHDKLIDEALDDYASFNKWQDDDSDVTGELEALDREITEEKEAFAIATREHNERLSGLERRKVDVKDRRTRAREMLEGVLSSTGCALPRHLLVEMLKQRFGGRGRFRPSQRNKVDDTVLAHLDHDGLTLAQVHRACGFAYKTSRAAVRRLVEDGRIEMVGEGKGALYKLAS